VHYQVPMIPKNAENGHFSRLEYKSEPYADMEKFSKTQPLDKRKLGFGWDGPSAELPTTDFCIRHPRIYGKRMLAIPPYCGNIRHRCPQRMEHVPSVYCTAKSSKVRVCLPSRQEKIRGIHVNLYCPSFCSPGALRSQTGKGSVACRPPPPTSFNCTNEWCMSFPTAPQPLPSERKTPSGLVSSRPRFGRNSTEISYAQRRPSWRNTAIRPTTRPQPR